MYSMAYGLTSIRGGPKVGVGATSLPLNRDCGFREMLYICQNGSIAALSPAQGRKGLPRDGERRQAACGS